MADNLQKLIELAKADGGKFFVIDEKGNPVLVIMGIEEYQKVLIKKLERQVEDIEEINKKIAAAQKADAQEQLKSEIIDSTFSFDEPNKIEVEEI